MIFGASTSRNGSAMRVIVFWEKFKVKYRFWKCKKKVEKKFFVFEIVDSKLVALNCLYSADNACHRQALSEQTVLGICLLLKKTFSNATTFKGINKYFKGAAI